MKGRLLLVEDSSMMRKMISAMLEDEGYEVALAVDGREGLAKAREFAPELILTDYEMPVMDGYTAVRRLRELGFQCPIVALTAHAMSGDRDQCLEAGCDDYATKPIQRETLLGVIQRLTSGVECGV